MAHPGGTDRFPKGCLLDELEAGRLIVRIHACIHGPIFFGPPAGLPPANRFDAPNGEYRMLYAAESLTGAFVETLLRSEQAIVSRAYVHDRQYSMLRARRALRLARVYNNGRAWNRAPLGVASNSDYTIARRYALELFLEFPEIDGIAYRSSHNDGQICYAIFDRADDAFEVGDTGFFHRDPPLVERLMLRHGAEWDDDEI